MGKFEGIVRSGRLHSLLCIEEFLTGLEFQCRQIMVILNLASTLVLHQGRLNIYSSLLDWDAITPITFSGYIDKEHIILIKTKDAVLLYFL